ncbi:hypothetical protein GJ744_007468 [Endocarpon pusillum]|uniref:DNA excision repair protein n=1 Tax=Endocarpon pusillum TaxID=364733 RepID=A0A8H7E6A3_9EURO|nr:hypothetical protein GJ744_007468 [Endocarpon pusillum]
MVSYDLDGSEAESDISHDLHAQTKVPGKFSSTGNGLIRNDAASHKKNKAIDSLIAEVHELDTSESSSTGEAVDLDQYGENEPPRKRRPLLPTQPERLEWSEDDSANDGEATYRKFQSKKSDHRKCAIRSTKKAKAIEAQNHQWAGGKTSTGVGKRTSKTKKASGSTEQGCGDANSDDECMEWTVPDYLKERRAQFNARAEKFKAGGLKLPPAYDEVHFSDDERLERLTERPQFPTDPPAKYEDIHLPYSLGLVPAPIAQWLRDYQVQGVEFLHELFVYQKGGILGDDMGLGKTVQVIAFLTAAYGKTGDERDDKRMRKMRRSHNRWYPRTLIICPGTLISNWQDEFRRWGWWHVDVYHGSADVKDAAISAAQSGRAEVMITTYTTYRMNRDVINMIAWDCCVADECHAIKERKSETTYALNEVNALCRIGLTGTAIQNKYEELWTLLNWTNPGRFGPISTWKASICDPLELGQSHDATVYQLSRARKTAKKLVENLLPPFFLRRMKTLIKDQLPKKSDRVVFCPLTQTQADAYERFLDGDVLRYIKQSAELCDCGSGKKMGWCCYALLPDGSKWQNHVFPAISTLQKLSNHLAILIPQSSDSNDKQDKDLELLRTCVPDQWRKLYAERDSIFHYSNPEFCGKWRILKKLLKFWHGEGNNKVLVFSHSVRLLKMLRMLFNHTSYSVSYLDGSMKYGDRYAVVTDFNTDPSQFVFLISTRAGGVGLNITSANKVVVVDPNWNPSYDLQAQDRAYRIGQTRDVEVFRLVSQGTLEEIVYARQIYKQQQANIGYNATTERRYFQGVRGRQDQKGEIFGLNNLFAYQNDNVVLRDIVNKTNIAESKADLRIASLELDDDKDEDVKKDIDADDDDPLDASFKTEEDNEEAAMSQLAAMITKDGSKPKKRSRPSKSELSKSAKHDPVQAILSAAGVQYTHENSEVIGSSKVEADLSKRAEEAAEGGSTQEQSARVFMVDSQSQASRNGKSNVTCQTNGIKYQYRPPEAVKKRQFCSMARWAGYKDAVEFALVVEGWTQEERRTCLDRFYEWRREVLAGEGDIEEEETDLLELVALEDAEEASDEGDEL